MNIRLKRTGTAVALAAALALGGGATVTALAAPAAVAAPAAPAAKAVPAAKTKALCRDRTDINGARVYYQPANRSGLVKRLGKAGYLVTGTCVYYNHKDRDGDHWYMQVYLGGGGYGYIWVQRLAHGSKHRCVNDGHLTSIPSRYCPLGNYR